LQDPPSGQPPTDTSECTLALESYLKHICINQLSKPGLNADSTCERLSYAPWNDKYCVQDSSFTPDQVAKCILVANEMRAYYFGLRKLCAPERYDMKIKIPMSGEGSSDSAPAKES